MKLSQEQFDNLKVIYEFLSEKDSETQVDFIIALGNHDLSVAEYAAKVFNQGYAPVLVCTGGFGKITSEIWNKSEGEKYAEICIDLGVPEESIIIEDKAANTGDNFTLSKKLLSRKGMSPKTGMIVSKPYMSKRALATAMRQWPEVRWISCSEDVVFEEYLESLQDIEKNVHLMVGDMQRMKVYVDRGFQAPVEIPENVWSAYESLVEDGFTDYIIK